LPTPTCKKEDSDFSSFAIATGWRICFQEDRVRRKFRYATAGLAIALACAPAAAQTNAKPDAAKPAPAPVSAEPQLTTASYGDWMVRCQHIGDAAAGQRVCEAAETIQTQGAQGPVAQIAIGRLNPSDPLRLTLVLPPNVGFPSSPRMNVDEKESHPIELNWRRCLPGGCFADAEIKDDLTQLWRKQSSQGSIKFKDGAGRDVALPFSFRGLAQALDALAKS
jgi:invasion protein IalB